ncbi:hypothetical protein [Anaerobiospirillum sp. NML120449]|uniref:hypothetical protein n=1 Tax=Anaerobiospirillum sp. NML120449 TaxID=2932817 RepID=UPI001FF162EE|nr:hypothetical protein [Anaerobiospirillum sp. NML120449]MCK0527463.1 hypothetical protein [Anaerobiospirillum sp. NML120449]
MRRDLIVGGSIADLVPVGIDGRYVYSSAESFRDALIFNRKSESDFSRNLAIPQVSLDGSHIDWYVPFEPAADKGSHDIVSWHDASEGLRSHAIEVFARMETALTILGRSMARQASQSSGSTVSRFLEHTSSRFLPALHFPGPENIYFIDGIPVITFWGFTRNMKTLSQSPFACLTQVSSDELNAADNTPVFKPVSGSYTVSSDDDSTDEQSLHSDANEALNDSSGTSKDLNNEASCEEKCSDARAEVRSAGGAVKSRNIKDERSSSVSRAVLTLAAAVFLLTAVLLLKFLGVFDSGNSPSGTSSAVDSTAVEKTSNDSTAAENQIYLDPYYQDDSAHESANSDKVSDAQSSEKKSENEGSENEMYLSEKYLNSQSSEPENSKGN